MAERRASWPWRKKTTPKGDKILQEASPASSFKYEILPSNAQNGRLVTEPAVPTVAEDPRLTDAVRLREQAEAKLKALEEQLSNALEDAVSKEGMAKQHEKGLEEAIAGWEKAEQESLSYKQELEVAAKQKVILEGRISHLDGALKECMKQVRHVKEEQEKKIEDTILAKTREWEEVKAEIDARQMDLERRLMESEAQNSAMTKSMQERAKKILEFKDAREKAETQGKVLQVKVVSLEKEISALKYELHVLNKELEIRNEEVEGNKKAADAAHKQHLENVKKVAKLEADCQRLKNLLRKKLPGPAAIAQMRREIDVPFSRENMTGDPKRRQRKSPISGSTSFSSSYGSELSLNSRDVEFLKDRVSSMEEETKFLREALSQRNEELNASRILCAKTASKLSIAEDHIESLHETSKRARSTVSDVNSAAEPNAGSVLINDTTMSGNGEEPSCAESWASALIGELAIFRKGNTVPQTSTECTEPCIATTEASDSNNELTAAQGVRNQAAAREIIVEDTIVYVRLQELKLLCKELECKFSTIQERLKLLKSDNLDNGQEAIKSIMCSFDNVHERFADLKNLTTQIEDLRLTCGAIQPSSPATMASSEDLSLRNLIPISSLHTVLSKLVSVLEAILPRCKHSRGITQSSVSDSPSDQKDYVPEQETAATSWDRQKEALIASKESFLEGKSAVSEFLLRYGILLCKACDLEHPELETLLASASSAGKPEVSDVSSSGFVSELAVVRDQLHQMVNAKAELEAQMAAVIEELGGARLELGASKELVVKLQDKAADLQAMKQNLAAVEAMKVELQQKLKSAEGDRSTLQSSVESLKLELDEERKARDGVLVKCEELERQLEGPLIYEECNGLKVTDEEDTRLSKDRELVAAKEKLAECQRTILALGKQLSALSSPPTEISPGGSFDAVSMDSMIEQRMHMELQIGAGSMEHHPNTHHQNHYHSHHGGDGRYDGNLTSPGIVSGQYSNGSRRGVHAAPPQQQQQQPVHPGWSSTGGGMARPRAYTEEMQVDTSRGWAGLGCNGSLSKGARLRNGPPRQVTEEHPHYQIHHHPPVLQRRPAYVSPSCQYSQVAPAWGPVYLAEEDEGQLARPGYSPPHTALSSPARSPGRFAQQARGGQPPGREGIRTSLAESMNAAATSASDNNRASNFGDVKAPSKPSAIGKLFSRSKLNR